jgi:hypothetical protein
VSNASDYLEEQIGTHLLRSGSWTKPAAIWVALFTAMPDDDGTGGTEVSSSATGYGRVQLNPGNSNWSAPNSGNGEFANLIAAQYGSPTALWGDIVGFGLYDAETAGNYLIAGVFPEPITVDSGDPAPAFAAGQLVITVA